jgi:tetratricopeptide (TPR) repeat protein
MKKYVVCVMMMVAFMSFGQKKQNKTPAKTEPAPATEAPAQTTQAPAQGNATQPTQQSQQVNPFVNHYLVKFNVAMRFSDPDAARDALYDLIVENPGNDSLFLNLAVMYYENQKYPSAILVSQELMARNSKNTTAIEIAASSFEALNLYDKALQHYETLYLQTNNYASLYKMAFLQFDLKRFKECSATSDILLSKKEADELKVSYPTADNKTKEFPIKVAILNLKGMVSRESGDSPGAKKLFEQALALAPDFVQAKENLSKLK